MRALILVLSACLAGTSVVSSQEHQPSPVPPRPVLVDDVPEGTNWIANARTRLYYRVGCPITASIPAADKLYYKSEASLETAGFTKSNECDAPLSPWPNGAAPVPQTSPIAPGTPMPAQAVEKAGQGKHRRDGFWFNGGLGYGSLGCEDCDGRTGALSGGLALGGTVSQKVLLGVGSNGWTKSENGAELTVGTLLAVIRFYTSATGGFFLLGGLGVGSIHGEVSGFGSDTETGYGALVGLGYDIRVGDNVSLTPFWNGFAANTSNADANVGQIGLGITLH
jgi:hypothetical protein